MVAKSLAKTNRVRAVLVVLTLALAFSHMLYNWHFGYRLFELRGGVQKGPSGWNRFWGIDKAWTTPIYLPACVVFEMGDKFHGSRPAPQPYGFIGGLLILAGSLVAGFAVASLILAAILRQRPILGSCLWRLWLVIVGWGWVLVPVELSWVYRWTVIY